MNAITKLTNQTCNKRYPNSSGLKTTYFLNIFNRFTKNINNSACIRVT
jgi:hypothetical protein